MTTDSRDEPSVRAASALFLRRASAPSSSRRADVGVFALALCVVIGALRVSHGMGARVWICSALAFASAAWAYAQRVAFQDRGARFARWGVALVFALEAAPAGARAGYVCALGDVGVFLACAAALIAFTKPHEQIGLAIYRYVSPAPLLYALGVVWLAPLAVRLAEAHVAHAASFELGASFVSFAMLIGAARSSIRRHDFDLENVARGRAALHLLALASALAVVLVVARADTGAILLSLALSSAAASWVLAYHDALRVARISRRIGTLAIFVGPIVLLGSTMLEGRQEGRATVLVVTALLTMVTACFVESLEQMFLPAHGVLLRSLARAREVVFYTDPDGALGGVLAALGEPISAGVRPTLWALHPPLKWSVDAAGYVHGRGAHLPPGLADIAAGEFGGTLRTSVLEALEVRRADLRPMLAWMRNERALCATVVRHAGETEAVLVLGSGARTEALSLEEVSLLGELARCLALPVFARIAMARSLAREQAERARADAAEHHAARFEHAAAAFAERNALATARLDHPAVAGVYSPAIRVACDAIERRTRACAPIALVMPRGVDPVPYIARAHLEGPRAKGPFVVVDGASSRDRDEAAWRAAHRSPLALAHGGLLLLVDGALLPRAVQSIIACALAERRASWELAEPLDVLLAMSGARAPRESLASEDLDADLFARLGDAGDSPIIFPRLADRPEDLRAILRDRLAREGLRIKGYPMGIDDQAFARLVEYPFPGEDVELAYVVRQLVRAAEGPVVRAADVDALGITGVSCRSDG